MESLTLRQGIGDRGGAAWCLEKLAEIAITNGELQAIPFKENEFRCAARLFGSAAALRSPVNSVIDLVDQPEHERQVSIVKRQLTEAIFIDEWNEGQSMTLEESMEYISTG